MATQTSLETPNAGVTLANVEVINHLLFHKAILDQDEGPDRINRYLHLVKEGEHVSIKDEFDRSIALVFDLVVQERLDPWDIDLARFAELYLKRARDEQIDLVTAGRIILLAWTVLKLQSDDLVRKFEARQQETQEMEGWDAIPDWTMGADELDFTERVRRMKEPIDEKIWHEGDRPVTLMELVQAFEVARQEAELRQKLTLDRESYKRFLKDEAARRFQGRVHKEDLEEDLRLIWQRISSLNGGPIPLKQIYDPRDLWDFVTAFNGVLFLHRDRKIQLWQDEFPVGPVYLRNLEAPGAAPKADESPRPPGDDEDGDDEDDEPDDDEDDEDDDNPEEAPAQ